MNLIDKIIENREKILEKATMHGVIVLKLYGSVLVKSETEHSDIDFLAIYDSSIPYDWEASFNLEEELKEYFGRRVGIVDSRNIPNVFRPSIDTDPVDIMELSSDKQYFITPKTSRLYYIMLDKVFKEFKIFEKRETLNLNEKTTLYFIIGERISWWFSRLLRLEDNDLKDYEDFNYIEVLYFSEKIIRHFDSITEEEIDRYGELLMKVKEYSQLKIID